MVAEQFGLPPWWQIAGALIAVFTLLMLALRALQRWQPGARQDGDVRLLSVRRLGPRRELQRLRAGATVHTLYRHEGAMVILGSEPWKSAAENGEANNDARGLAVKPRLKAWLAAAGTCRRMDLPADSQNN